MLLEQDEGLSDVARESGRNVRQCKSKLKVLPDIAISNFAKEMLRFVNYCQRKLRRMLDVAR
jgi:hypothetical protein